MHTGYSSIRRSRCRSHVPEVTFRSHYNAYHLFSNTTRLSSSLFNGGKIMLYSNIFSQIHLSFYCNYTHQKTDSNVAAMCNLCGGEMKTHCHEILFCKTMLDIVDHFMPIIPAIDSKAISKRELIFGLTLGDKSMNLRNMIIFTIR